MQAILPFEINNRVFGLAQRSTNLRTREALLKIFYRPRDVFAAQKEHSTWIRVVFLLAAIFFTDILVIELTELWQESTHADVTTDSLIVQDSQALVTVQAEEIGDQSNVDDFTLNRDLGEEDSAVETESFYLMFSPAFTFVFVLASLVAMFLSLLLEATYLRIVSAIMDLGLNLDRWLTLAVWSLVPGDVVATLITILVALTTVLLTRALGTEPSVLTGLIEGTDKYAYLFFGYLAMIWCVVLRTIGFRDWSGKGTLVSFAIVVVPSLVNVGLLAIWAFV